MISITLFGDINSHVNDIVMIEWSGVCFVDAWTTGSRVTRWLGRFTDVRVKTAGDHALSEA
jgi:hypothetical protein